MAAVVLLFYLTPKLALLVTSLNLPMPVTTRALVTLSELVRTHLAWILLVAGLGGMGSVFFIRRSPELAEKLDGFTLSLPVLGLALRKRILARVTGLLALLLQSGVGLLDGLQACAESADNRVIRRKLLAATQLIASGGGVSDSLARQAIFPPLVLRMVYTGEANGALAEALENVAWFFERDSKETVARSLKLLEPGLAAMLGLILALLLLSVFLPIYQIIGGLPL